MGATTLFWCLIGQRRAILRVAETRYAVWVGLLLVISAGLARDYDREDLWHEPWNLLPPIGASLVSSFLLFSMLWRSTVRAERLQEGSSFLRAYRVFLGLFWMTAPMAWLYALPVERFLSEVDATRVNLLLLGIVATWRVILMNRMASILFGGGFAAIRNHLTANPSRGDALCGHCSPLSAYRQSGVRGLLHERRGSCPERE